MTVVRAAITQVAWTGDKESMIARHEDYARQAADQGAGIICFQELFYGPYFGIVQDQKYYEYTESIPGPTVERFQALARELGLVMVLPIYEVANEGEYYNTAAVVDADGSLLGNTASTTFRTCPSSGRSSTSVRATSATPSSRPRSDGSASTSVTTGIFPKGGASSA